MKTTKKVIGSVGVDSGQLMIVDPAYLNSHWKSSGRALGLKFWGSGQELATQLIEDKGYVVQDAPSRAKFVGITGPDTIKELRAEIIPILEAKGLKLMTAVHTDSSYDQVCDLTLGEEQAGELSFESGVSGFLTAFTTGFGDGLYDVVATYSDMGDMGERISKIEINFLDVEETE